MQVTNQMIAKDMRIEGILWRTFVHLNSVKKFERAQKIISHLKGKAPKNPNVEMQQINIPGNDGNVIRLCVYTPKNRRSDTSMTGLLWIHGGGYAIGVPEMENITIARFIDVHDTIVVSPDYRLSLGLKSIFETDFKGHSEPRLPSTAQINHQLRLITYLNPGKH